MSLLEEAFEKFTIMDKTSVPDGYGGTLPSQYTEGITIEGALPLTSNPIVEVAHAVSGRAYYMLTVKKNVSLDLHTVLKRQKDGKYYRTLSGSDENQTPASAGLNMRQYKIEDFNMPT